MGNKVSGVSKGNLMVEKMGTVPLDLGDDDTLLEACVLLPEQSMEDLVELSRSKSKLSEWLNVLKSAQSSHNDSVLLRNRVPENAHGKFLYS